MNKFINSVKLNKNLCRGCINCIKQCPTQAIRVHNGKAQITDEFCVDCGKCIKSCPYHAKYPDSEKISVLKEHKYNVALPTAALYGQFNNLTDPDIVLNALLDIGFDDVFEVSVASELVSEVSRKYIEEHKEEAPFISTHCPAVVRLVRIRFPGLISRLLPIKAPSDVAAEIALNEAMKKTGLPAEDIGIVFISSCPAKMTSVKAPLGIEKSAITNVVGIKDIYPLLLPHMTHDKTKLKPLSRCSKIGIGWGGSGGEVCGLSVERYLTVDGINNVLKILEDLEDEKIHDVTFLELHACNGGCVGGVLAVENPYIAQSKLKKLGMHLPDKGTVSPDMWPDIDFLLNTPIEYEPVFRLGKTFRESLAMMDTVEDLTRNFPGLDCGSCGAPTCRALAEDIVREKATSNDCIYVFRNHLASLSGEMTFLSKAMNLACDQYDPSMHVLKDYIQKLDDALSSKSNPLNQSGRLSDIRPKNKNN